MKRVKPANIRARLYVVAMVLALTSSALVVRAVDLQVVRKDFYQEQGDQRFLRDIPIPVSRGTIFDRNGEPLAVSTPVESIWANPTDVLSAADRLPELAKALGLDEEDLKQKLVQRSDKEFVYLKRHLNPDDAKAIVDLGIPGVASEREFRRYYPSGEVMAHVLGFTGADDIGQEGVELAFQDRLTGKPGSRRVIKDRLGQTVEDVESIKAAQDGRDLSLALDARIQNLAFSQLKAAVAQNRAKAGGVFVLGLLAGYDVGRETEISSAQVATTYPLEPSPLATAGRAPNP